MKRKQPCEIKEAILKATEKGIDMERIERIYSSKITLGIHIFAIVLVPLYFIHAANTIIGTSIIINIIVLLISLINTFIAIVYLLKGYKESQCILFCTEVILLYLLPLTNAIIIKMLVDLVYAL